MLHCVLLHRFGHWFFLETRTSSIQVCVTSPAVCIDTDTVIGIISTEILTTPSLFTCHFVNSVTCYFFFSTSYVTCYLLALSLVTSDPFFLPVFSKCIVFVVSTLQHCHCHPCLFTSYCLLCSCDS